MRRILLAMMMVVVLAPRTALARSATLRLEVSNVDQSLEAVKAEIARRKGVVESEEAVGRDGSYSASVEARIPAAALDAFVAWTKEKQGLVKRQVQAEDDDEKGGDATLSIAILRSEDEGPATPSPSIFMAARAMSLAIRDPQEDAQRMRAFGLAYLGANQQGFGLELDVTERERGSGRPSVLATLGGIVFSEYLGGGRRTYLNPFLGFRFGYGSHARQQGVAFLLDAGLELVRLGPASLAVFGRGVSILHRDGATLGSGGGVSVSVPF